MNVLQLLQELLPPRLRVLAKHRERALVLAGREHLEVHIVLLQQAVDVRHLRGDADGTDHGERRRQDAVRHRRHEVATARRHLVDGRHQADALALDARQLRSAQTVGMHQSAAALDAHQHFVAILGAGEDRRHFIAQADERGRFKVALEVHDEDARLVVAGLELAFHGLVLALQPLLELGRRRHGLLHRVAQLPQPVVQACDLNVRGRWPVTAGGGRAEQHQHGGDDGHRLGQEAQVVEQVIH